MNAGKGGLRRPPVSIVRVPATGRRPLHAWRRANISGVFEEVVGVAGFEPATPSSRTRCATRLRHAPTVDCVDVSPIHGNGANYFFNRLPKVPRRVPFSLWWPKKLARHCYKKVNQIVTFAPKAGALPDCATPRQVVPVTRKVRVRWDGRKSAGLAY